VIVLNFAITGAFQIGLVLIARQRLGGASSLGIVLASGAVGSLLGTLAGGTFRPRRVGLMFIFVPSYVGIVSAIFAFTSILAVAMALFFISAARGIPCAVNTMPRASAEPVSCRVSQLIAMKLKKSPPTTAPSPARTT
jgi:hypothetical protein